MSFPLSQSVDQTIAVLLAPGEKARLSPLVESAQLFFLTHAWPNDRKRYDSIQAILKQEQAQVRKLAKTWMDSRARQFSEEMYQSDAYLKMYAAYYFSVNVGKLQILLHDLLRCGELPETIHAADIGVGAGSTAIALLDFFYALGIACQLHHQPFPLKEFSLVGYDRSEQALQATCGMVSAYTQAVQRRKEAVISSGADPSSLDLIDKILSWVENITWQKLDIEKASLPAGSGANLVVLSNLLNELGSRNSGSSLEASLQALAPGALILAIEPGEQKKTFDLISWRESFISDHADFESILPCGQGLSGPGRNPCANCWAARRESLHQPQLYQSFLQACGEITGDPREVDAYQNNLLSWSYAVLKHSPGKRGSASQEKLALAAGNVLSGPVRLRVMGKFHQKPNLQNAGKSGYQLVDYPVDQDPFQEDSREWDEYLKVCTQPFPQTKFLVIKRQKGFEIPRLRFGQETLVSNIGVEPFAKGAAHQVQLVPLQGGQTQIQPVSPFGSQSLASGFLSKYDEQARKAVDELAYRLFGFPGMRPFQHEILGRVLRGKSIFGIAATGGGKSECFILPAMVLPGVTIVISPLKSLMTDQYDQRLNRRFGLGDLATYINGDVPFKERQARLKRMELGYYKIVYFTPEQLERGFILDCLKRTNQAVGVRYLAMDEAHCISQWGHDFRPSYLNIVKRFDDYKIKPVIIALTATASRHVRQDVCEELNLNPLPVDQGGDVFVYSSNRPEINFAVRVMHTNDEKVVDILDELHTFQRSNQLEKAPGAALVFLPYTGGSPESTWRYLPKKSSSKRGRYSAGVTGFASYLERVLKRRVAIYHGKMDNDEPEYPAGSLKKPLGDLSGRTRIQEQTRFINSIATGTDIMVATKGFGMGIDKPNIRLIIHRTPTSNLEAYAQEAGRAGRDGDLATAILYYSPDTALDEDDGGGEGGVGDRLKEEKVKSDHQIQEFFLSDKYIRKVDVIVMRAFLKQIEHKLTLAGRSNPYLYFTSDEAMDFFYTCRVIPETVGLRSAYEWPKFPERESSPNEFGDHKYLLDKGFFYEQKTRYINRILAALFRIRPDIDGRVHQSFLDSAQETGAKLLLHHGSATFDWENIYGSNAYYGEIFRRNQVTEREFKEALHAGDLLPFAQRLNLTLCETVGIFSDIKSAEGDFIRGEWKPALLNFSRIIAPLYGPAAGKDTLQLWREYAGTSKRATKPVAEERARKMGRKETIADDWFGWSEVTSRTGWEVLPGPAFETNFEPFLEAFMQLHDERERNDWASYHRLLTDYVGVREDGRIPPENGEKKCLRSVLLGYLESYEVVVDGNCYSCSHCVPDGDFEKYPVAVREKAVIRMTPALVTAFDEMKELDKRLPDQASVDRFFDSIDSEEAAGRSLFNYFSGWSGRLLNDDPDHLTAQWLRIIAMTRNIIMLQEQEFLNLASSLVERLPIPMLQPLAEILENQRNMLNADPRYLKTWVQLFRRNNQHQQEAYALAQLVQYYENQKKMDVEEVRGPIRRLTELYAKSGPIAVEKDFRHWLIVSGRIARTYAESLKAYSEATIDFDWSQILGELEEQRRWMSEIFAQAALITSWMRPSSEEKRSEWIEWAGSHMDKLRQWPEQAQKSILSFLPDELIIQSDDFLNLAVTVYQSDERIITLGLKRLAITGNLSELLLVQLGSLLSSQDSLAGLLEEIIPNPENRSNVLSVIIPYLELKKWTSFKEWEGLFDQYHIPSEQTHSFVMKVIKWAASSSDHENVVLELTPTILPYADDWQIRELIIAKWLPVYINYPLFLGRTLQALHHTGAPAEYLADAFLDRVIEESWDVLSEIPGNIGYARWQKAILMVNKIDAFIDFVRKNPGEHRLEYKHLVFLKESFEWTKNPDEADMLAAILSELRKKSPPGWKTIAVILMETLVISGRSSMAEEAGRNQTDLSFVQNGHKVSLYDYLASVHIAQRSEPISPDYLKIAEKSLLRF